MNRYKFVRRYVLLDRDNKTYKIIKDKLLEVEASDADTANQSLIEEINRTEGTAGVIPDGGRTSNDVPYIGWYIDRNLEYPQLPSLDRMNCNGEIFDYIFYTWGGKNYGKNDRYLYVDGITYEPCSSENGIWHFIMEDVELEVSKEEPYRFCGKLLLFLSDYCTSDEEQLHIEMKLFRTDDAHFILYSAVEDAKGVLHFPAVIHNSSPKYIYSRALRILEDYPSSRSKAFINNMEKILKIK